MSVCEDRGGAETQQLLGLWGETQPKAVLIDAPRAYKWVRLLKAAKRWGYGHGSWEVQATLFGDGSARQRTIGLFVTGMQSEDIQKLEAPWELYFSTFQKHPRSVPMVTP